jgi:hypothetical protein
VRGDFRGIDPGTPHGPRSLARVTLRRATTAAPSSSPPPPATRAQARRASPCPSGPSSEIEIPISH